MEKSEREIFSIKRKALRLNLNQSIYGTLAEIGGGQEVARAFFQAGGASGTVAKSISAYDKTFSDTIYNENKPGRYVSENRLMKMLDKEFDELNLVLDEDRHRDTNFFVFANTVETLNFNKDNDPQGWLGVRFQLAPDSTPNDVVLHVRLLENDSLLQQYTLGALGVNLIYACFHYHDQPNTFLKSLTDYLSTDRIEITMIRMTGPQLKYVDNRLLAVQLVSNGMTNAIMFDRNGNVQEPADMLYKKNILAFRGSFRPITYVGFDMLKSSFSIFKKDKDYDKFNTLSLCEITLKNLLSEGSFDERDFLDRVDLLNGMGQNVMVSNLSEYYKLVSYFTRFTIKNLRVIIGVPTLLKVLDKKYYNHLKGGILEAFGKLFTDNMKLYVYPAKRDNSDELLTSKNLPLPPDLKHIYRYLIENRKIIDIEDVKVERLHIFSHRVLEMLKKGDKEWERMVPKYVSTFIKTRKVFGYKEG
ncbi:MAG: hypothetical protein JSV24_00430 [Bacteroidales bacterium]|nr:MAG: hypothetical protein JSV24_00430 [Bacteroidales bacterium]